MVKNPGSSTRSGHQPSQYRALVREAKKGDRSQDIGLLIKMARQLKDPYFRALGLFTLSSDKRLKLAQASATARDALDGSSGVGRGWRKAELLTLLAKKLVDWRAWDTSREGRKSKESLEKKLTEQICTMPIGKGRSDAIKGSAKWLGRGHHETLLRSALTNKGFVLADARAVIRAWASAKLEKENNDGLANDMALWLAEVDEPSVRAKLLAYLHLQLRKARRSYPSPTPLDEALRATDSIADEGLCLETLRYLASVAETKDELEAVIEKTARFDELASTVRLLAAAAGRADKEGFPEQAKQWFFKGLTLAPEVKAPEERASITLNLALGLARCGVLDEAQKAFGIALEDCERVASEKRREKLEQRIKEAMKGSGALDDGAAERREAKPHEQHDENDLPHSKDSKKRHVLALYDTYEGGLKPAHFRAVARAAPLCVAFGLDLALIGFPTDDLERLVRETITETGVGKGGRYVKQLLAQRRLSLIPTSWKEPPGEWGSGTPVATSSHPNPKKKVELEELIEKKTGDKEPTRLILIMGLGKRGLPPSVLKSVSYHLELTGTNVPLETCTVMGILAERLSSLTGEIKPFQP